MEELRRQLADAPAEVVVANHCYGLFELAAVYLSQTPPRLAQAQLAIDALGHLIDGLGPRLGDAHEPLRDALAQIRLAYVQLGAASQAPSTPGAGGGQGNGAASPGGGGAGSGAGSGPEAGSGPGSTAGTGGSGSAGPATEPGG